MTTERKLLPKDFDRAYDQFLAQWEHDQETRRLQKRIKERNRRFSKKSPDEKRVTIARDVLRQLGTKIRPHFGVWARFIGDVPVEEISDSVRNIKTELAEVEAFADDDTECRACALGSLFVCAVRQADGLKAADVEWIFEKIIDDEDEDDGRTSAGLGQNDIFGYLERFFEHNQLRLIELAFERGRGGISYDTEQEKRAARLWPEMLDPVDRMEAVMRNIVRNKGRFVV